MGSTQFCPAGQAERCALRGRPGAGRLGSGGQAHVVTAGQHRRGKGARQHLAQRQDGDLLAHRVRRHVAGGFEHRIHPAGELAQGKATGGAAHIGKLGLGALLQPQHGQQARAGGIQGHRPCQAGGVQQCAQIAQPGGQGSWRAEAGAGGSDVGHPRSQSRSFGVRAVGRAQAFSVTPVAQALAAQPGFERQARRLIAPGRRVLQGVEHVVAAGVPGQGAQQGHEFGRHAGGGEFPAVFIADGHAPRTQQCTHAAGERAVGGGQGHGHAAGLDVGQHPGGGAFGFILGVDSGEQAHLAARGVQR